MASTQSNRIGPVVVRKSDAVRQETTGMRAARIDQLSVDRSHFAHYPLPTPSPEMAKAEQRLERLFARNEVTQAERLAAWREFLERQEKAR
jgi:hypothetical protein